MNMDLNIILNCLSVTILHFGVNKRCLLSAYHVCAGQAVTQCGHMWYEYGPEYHFKLLECDNIAFRSKQEVFIKCIPPAKGNKYLLFKQCIIFLLKFPLY